MERILAQVMLAGSDPSAPESQVGIIMPGLTQEIVATNIFPIKN